MASDFRGNSNYPRGLRNNNPGNISDIKSGWLGQVGSDGRFAIFDSMPWGIRAFLSNYYSSIQKHNTKTLTSYLHRYAPNFENDTTKYINTVASYAGIDANGPIPTDQATVSKIMRAQFNVELGKQYADMITDEDIAEGFSLLDSRLKTFFNSISIFYHTNPVATYGIAATAALTATLIVVGSIRIIRNIRKK